jgi:hypothetical protein
MLHASHAPRPKRIAIHDERIELYLAFPVQETASSGIESLVFLHDDHSGFNCVEGGSTAFENAPTSIDGIPNTIEVGLDKVVWDGPCAAVDDKYGMIAQKDLKENSSV